MERIILNYLRKLYKYFILGGKAYSLRNWKMFSNKEYANELIYRQLIKDEPCMIARFGSTEMSNLVNYLGVKYNNKNFIKYIKNEVPPWWWEKKRIMELKYSSGFFPPTIDMVEKFCDLMLNDIKMIDILGSWLLDERFFENELKNAKRVVLEDLEPFFAPNPWTKALENKKVLVVHPFTESIEKQYKKRKLLFENELLPEFELITIKAVQSVAGMKTEYRDWFEALEYMKSKINEKDFDISIIGAGAYGLPLAAHVKRLGKKAFHLGGVTQLLFGIIGKRWEKFIVWPYMNLFNEHWVRPSEHEKIKDTKNGKGDLQYF